MVITYQCCVYSLFPCPQVAKKTLMQVLQGVLLSSNSSFYNVLLQVLKKGMNALTSETRGLLWAAGTRTGMTLTASGST